VADDLYVLQNVETGHFKIGRSKHPDKRCQAIRNQSGMAIDLVLVLPEQGDRELSIHAELSEYRHIGEWFDYSTQSKEAIERAVGQAITFKVQPIIDAAQIDLYCLEKRRRRWYAVQAIPRGLVAAFKGKRRLVRSLQTSVLRIAIARRKAVLADFARQFAEAKRYRPSRLAGGIQVESV
jgi:hypothetical protein